MSDNFITILGSSSGLPQADRATSGYLLGIGSSYSLIDCGGGVTSSFLKRGIDPLQVDRVFISHTHSDHVCELTLFIQLIHLKGRTEPFDIYIPKDFVIPFESYLNSVYLIKERLPFQLNITGYEPGFKYSHDFSLTTITNSHLKHYGEVVEKLGLPNKLQCCSFQIDVGSKRIFYSSDIGAFEDIADNLDGNDVVIIESTHIDLKKFFSKAQEIIVGRYVITHLGTKEEINEIVSMANKYDIDNLEIAMDGMTIEF